MRVTSAVPSGRFARDYKALPEDVRGAVDRALVDLLKDPIPASRRAHRLSGHLPPIYVIDVFSNHAWQVTYTLESTTATLLRVARHSDINRRPR